MRLLRDRPRALFAAGPSTSRAVRLLLLLGLALVPLLVALPLAVVSGPRLAEDAFGAALAQHALSAQRGWVDSVRQVLVATARSSDVTSGDPARCNGYIQSIATALPHYTGLGFIGTDGHEACTPDRVPRLYLGDRRYFIEAMQRGDFVIGEFLIGRTSGRKVLGFGMPARDARQQIVGVVFATLDLEAMSRQMLAQWPRDDVHIRLVDALGRVILTNRPEQDRLGEPLEPAPLRQAALDAQTATLRTRDAAGRRWDHRVEPGPSSGLFVTVSQPRPPIEAMHVGALLLAAALLTAAMLRFWRATEAPDVPSPIDAPASGVEAAAAAPPRAAPESAWLLAAQRVGAPGGWVLDPLSGELEASALAADTVGWAAERAGQGTDAPPLRLGIERFLGRIDPQDRDRLTKALAAVRDGQDTLDLVHRIVGRDGTVRSVHLLGQRVTAPDGSRRIVGAVRDVSETTREREALQLLRFALARIGDIVILAERPVDGGPDSLRIVYVNETYERLTGHSRATLQGVHLRGPALNEPALVRIRAAMQARVTVREELAFEARDGRLLWLDTDISPLPDVADGRVHFIAVQRDITEKKAVYEAAGATLRRLQDTLHGMTDGFIVLDLEWRYSFVNEQGAALLGRSAEELLGRHYGDLFPEAVENEFGRTCRATREDGMPRAVEFEHAVWQRWFACHMYPTPDGTAVFFHEVTARRAAEQGTEKLVRGLHALRQLDGALVQAWSFDEVAREGLHHARLLTQADRAALVRREHGVPGTSLVSDDDGFSPVSADALVLPAALWQSLEDDGVLREDATAIAAWPDARSLLALPLQADGLLLGALVLTSSDASHFETERLGLARDIADRLAVGLQQASMRARIERHAIELEARVAERTAALVLSNRELEAVSYSLSHDLSAPAEAIARFSSELVDTGSTLGDADRHLVQRIHANAHRMTEIIAAMLSLARITHAGTQRVAVDVSELAAEIVAALREREPARQVTVRIDAGLRVMADRAMLRVVLENLLGNAWKFSARAEAPHIELLRGDADRPRGPWLVVRDNGSGFDMAHAERLFTPFHRLHAASDFPGTGIGLATVRRIVELHGGQIEARSHIGGPTEIAFSLPGMAGR